MDALKRIIELKEKANISSAELCRISGIPQTTMSKIEHRIRSVDLPVIEKVCASLHISLKDFFDVEDSEILELNPEYIKLVNTAKDLPIEKLKILNEIANEFKETTFIVDGQEIKIKQKSDAPEILTEDLIKLVEYLKNSNDKKEP